MFFLLILIPFLFVWGEEISLERFLRDTIEGNREIKAIRQEVLSLRSEARAARRDRFPYLVIEETFLRTNVPAQVLFAKLNQRRVSPADLSPSSLNYPDPISNFETKLQIEIPIWLGGRLRSAEEMAKIRWRIGDMKARRETERILLDAYSLFVRASFLREAVEVARKDLEDARENLRIVEALHKTGMALLADVLRAKVAVKRAEDNLRDRERLYRDALEEMSLMSGRTYQDVEPAPLGVCPQLPGRLTEVALEKREDLKALEENLKLIEVSRSLRRSEILPSVSAFAGYSLYDRDTPFGSEGSGYSLGLKVSLRIGTGLGTLERIRSEEYRRKALVERLEHMRQAVLVGVRKAEREYRTASDRVKSALARLEEAEEVVRVLRVRYKNGLARLVDLLDAQRDLGRARVEYLEALMMCHLSYAKALFEAGVLTEVVR